MPRTLPGRRRPAHRERSVGVSWVRGALAAAVALTLSGLPALSAMADDDDEPSAAVRSVAAEATLRSGELVVKLAPGATIEEINRRLGSTTRSTLLASRSIDLLDVPLSTQATDPKKKDKEWSEQAKVIVDSLSRDRSVIYAEINTDADAAEGERFHHWPSGGLACTGDSATYLNQPAATQLALNAVHGKATGKGTLVAVLDTGVDVRHPLLAPHLIEGATTTSTTTTPPTRWSAGRPGRRRPGGRGVRPRDVRRRGRRPGGARGPDRAAAGARLRGPRRCLHGGRGGVRLRERRVDVINMSFGTVDKVESKVLNEAIAEAEKAGIVVVAAAGNDGTGSRHYPASVSGVLSVAALTVDGTRLAPFSTRGGWVDLAAPGVDITSTAPCGYGTWSGTSMAAPFVAGTAALAVSKNNGGKVGRTREDILTSARSVKGVQVHDGVVDLRRLLRVK